MYQDTTHSLPYFKIWSIFQSIGFLPIPFFCLQFIRWRTYLSSIFAAWICDCKPVVSDFPDGCWCCSPPAAYTPVDPPRAWYQAWSAWLTVCSQSGRVRLLRPHHKKHCAASVFPCWIAQWQKPAATSWGYSSSPGEARLRRSRGLTPTASR